MIEHWVTVLEKFLPQVVAAFVIVIVGFVIALLMRRTGLRHIKMAGNVLLKNFLVNLIFIGVLLLTGIVALTKLGVPTASLITLLGAMTLAIGLALKDFLANIAAGFMIVTLRPFKVDDFIQIGGQSGTVKDINLFLTRLNTPTNEGLFIPNRLVIQDKIINTSYYDVRKLDLTIGIDYSADVLKAQQLVLQALSTLAGVISDPQPVVNIQALADSSVNLLVQVWVKRLEYATKKSEILYAILQILGEHQIDIPFPQLAVHMKA